MWSQLLAMLMARGRETERDWEIKRSCPEQPPLPARWTITVPFPAGSFEQFRSLDNTCGTSWWPDRCPLQYDGVDGKKSCPEHPMIYSASTIPHWCRISIFNQIIISSHYPNFSIAMPRVALGFAMPLWVLVGRNGLIPREGLLAIGIHRSVPPRIALVGLVGGSPWVFFRVFGGFFPNLSPHRRKQKKTTCSRFESFMFQISRVKLLEKQKSLPISEIPNLNIQIRLKDESSLATPPRSRWVIKG